MMDYSDEALSDWDAFNLLSYSYPIRIIPPSFVVKSLSSWSMPGL